MRDARCKVSSSHTTADGRQPTLFIQPPVLLSFQSKLPSPGNTLSEPNLEHYPRCPYPSSSLWHLMIVSASQLQYLKWCVCPMFLMAAAIPLNPLSVAVVGVVAEAQSKSCSFNYTQSVLSIISNQPLISSRSCVHCSCLYSSKKTQLMRADQAQDPVVRGCRVGAFNSNP